MPKEGRNSQVIVLDQLQVTVGQPQVTMRRSAEGQAVGEVGEGEQ